MSKKIQLANKLKKSIESINFRKIGESQCKNEEQTKQFLILPFMELLGYSSASDIIPEYNADFGSRKGKKVDYAILLGSKDPQIIIECKKFGAHLDRHTSQLNEYFINTSSSKIGILTNGLEYRFFVSENKKPLLHSEPFFTFEVDDTDTSALKDLASFHKDIIDVNEITEEANQIIFDKQFSEALYEELRDPSDGLISSIYSRMGIGKRMTSQMKERLSELINIHSLKDSYDRILAEDVASGKTGIITTKEELQAYHIIRTILVSSRGITSDRISYRDQKTVFSILVDDNQKKKVCDLKINDKKKEIIIDGDKTEFKDINDLLKLKKQLVSRTLALFES